MRSSDVFGIIVTLSRFLTAEAFVCFYFLQFLFGKKNSIEMVRECFLTPKAQDAVIMSRLMS